MIQKVEVMMKSISPLLMNRFPLEPVEAIAKKTKEEQAEIAAYKTPKGELYIPGVAVQRALINSAVYSKGKGRASLQKTAAACILVTPEWILLGANEYVIDSRPVVNPPTKGRIIRHRPRLDEWQITFTIQYEDTLLTEKQIRKIVDDAGNLVGFLDFRPACKGQYGRSMVIEWKREG